MSDSKDLPWAEVECDAQPYTVVSRDLEMIVVKSACPRCTGVTKWPFLYGRPGEKASTTLAEDKLEGEGELGPVVICACGVVHKDRPSASGESGCGAFWRLEKSPAR